MVTYMQAIDAWLNELLAVQGVENEAQWFARVKPEIRAKLLESYRNGQKACPKCSPPKPRYAGKKARHQE
ncbi:MAG: hypothetical protein DMF72_00200 [Acidobacteria bacterium]|nr:MAG: hypothetical protein DMF72_00200 [Acidobacteriota bacterium]